MLESGFPKAAGVVLVLNVLFHSSLELFMHSMKFKHSTEETEWTVAYLETEVPQLQVRFSCNSGVSLSTEVQQFKTSVMLQDQVCCTRSRERSVAWEYKLISYFSRHRFNHNCVVVISYNCCLAGFECETYVLETLFTAYLNAHQCTQAIFNLAGHF